MKNNFYQYVEDIALSGSPAQCTWANTLRQKRAFALNQMDVKGIAMTVKHLSSDQHLLDIGCRNVKHLAQFMMAIGVRILSDPSARNWIDSRETPINTLLCEAYAELKKEYTRNPPWPHDL